VRLLILALAFFAQTPMAWAETGYSCEFRELQLLAPYSLRSYYLPELSTETPERPEIMILGTQKTIGDWAKHDAYKRAMQAGTFDYTAKENVVTGYYHERARAYVVSEGHHRFAAALEIAMETDNWGPFKNLVHNGKWSKTLELPQDRYRLPVRSNWLNFLGWRRFLNPITPGWRELWTD
jgi:hypothetical protein